MRVLLTGSEGFTGRYVQRELEECGHEVIGLNADLNDVQALSDAVRLAAPQAVIHLAAIAYVGHGDANDIYRVNLLGTRNLLVALEQHAEQLQCVLLASSANVYGNHLGGDISEAALPAPVNDYAVSKLSMEYMAKLWMDKLPIIITRPFNYTGVGQDERFLIPKLVAHFARRAAVIELGNIEVEREFNDVRVVSKSYASLLVKGERGQTYNICSGEPVSLRSVVENLQKITGHTIEIKVNPALVRENEIRRLCGNPEKLASCIGKLHHRSLDDTLRWMLTAS